MSCTRTALMPRPFWQIAGSLFIAVAGLFSVGIVKFLAGVERLKFNEIAVIDGKGAEVRPMPVSAENVVIGDFSIGDDAQLLVQQGLVCVLVENQSDGAL